MKSSCLLQGCSGDPLQCCSNKSPDPSSMSVEAGESLSPGVLRDWTDPARRQVETLCWARHVVTSQGS